MYSIYCLSYNNIIQINNNIIQIFILNFFIFYQTFYCFYNLFLYPNIVQLEKKRDYY